MLRIGSITILLYIAATLNAQGGQFKIPQGNLKGIPDYDLLTANRKEINWRNNSKVDFELRSVKRQTKPVGTLVIWAFGNPKENPRRFDAKDKATNNSYGKIVYTQNLGQISDVQKFTVDFNDFAPQSKFFMVLSQKPTGLTSDQLAMYNLAKEMEAANKKQAQEIIGKQGLVEYIAQVVTADGGGSSWVSINYGEPKPGAAKTEAQVMTIRGTPEFPDPQYNTITSVYKDDSSLEFRWKTGANAKKAMIRIIDGTFNQGWGLWFKEGTEMTSAIVSSAPNTWTAFKAGSLKLPAKSKTGTISFQVTPLKDDGDIAGLPSNPVVVKVTTPQPPPISNGNSSKKLQYQIELVGWQPPYLGSIDDKYRFVIGGPLNPKIEGNVTEIIGKKPAKGDKVYLPPQPPKKEDPWYKKVYRAIASVIDFISKEVDLISANLLPLIDSLLKAGPEYVAKKAGVSQSDIKKAWGVAEGPFKIADDGLAPLRAIQGAPQAFTSRMMDDMGIKDAKTRAALGGNLRGAVDDWARNNSYLSPTSTTMQGLCPDPDFQVHTAIAFVRVRSNKVAGLPSDYREPGPVIEIKVGSFSGESESIGVKPEYFELFNQTYKGPTMGSDEEIILAIPLKYHWSHEQKYKTWEWGIVHNQKTLFTMNGNAKFIEPVFKKWGKTVN